MEGLSGKEISEELNIANGTVKSRLSRARNILNEKFKI
jgi:DNA-directed RNA polymerase specialized sigma24 family protein